MRRLIVMSVFVNAPITCSGTSRATTGAWNCFDDYFGTGNVWQANVLCSSDI